MDITLYPYHVDNYIEFERKLKLWELALNWLAALPGVPAEHIDHLTGTTDYTYLYS